MRVVGGEDVEDAAIASSLASASSASMKLMSYLGSSEAARAPRKDQAAAYDEVLIASQDAVDATKHAIDELLKEEVGQSDHRMQSLQLTRTAVEYALVGWRVGRNRTLIGAQDGAITDDGTSNTNWKSKGNERVSSGKPLGRSKKLGRLRERVVLYDGIIQVTLYPQGARKIIEVDGCISVSEHRFRKGTSWRCQRRSLEQRTASKTDIFPSLEVRLIHLIYPCCSSISCYHRVPILTNVPDVSPSRALTPYYQPSVNV